MTATFFLHIQTSIGNPHPKRGPCELEMLLLALKFVTFHQLEEIDRLPTPNDGEVKLVQLYRLKLTGEMEFKTDRISVKR